MNLTFLSCTNNPNEQKYYDNQNEQPVEIFTTNDGLKYSQDARSIEIYGLDDSTDRVNLVIPAKINNLPVTKIASYAFRNEKAIASVELPDTIEEICEYAFNGCESLAKINIPASVKKMSYAFGECTALYQIDLAEGLEVVEGFSDCSALTELKLPSTVKKVGELTWTNITSLELPDSVEEINHLPRALKSIKLSSNLKIIGDYAFSYSNITQIEIPDSVEEIGSHAFEYTKIPVIKLPNGLKKIGGAAFNYSAITEITIPDSVEYFGGYRSLGVFEETALKSINIPKSMTVIENDFFYKSNVEEVYIPTTVKEINCEFLDYCNKLKKVTIACDFDENQTGSINIYGEKIEVEELETYESYTDEDGVFHPETSETVTRTKFKGVDLVFEDSAKVISGKNFNGYYKSVDFGNDILLKDFDSGYAFRGDYADIESIDFSGKNLTFENCEFEAKKMQFDSDCVLKNCKFRVQNININIDLNKMERCQFIGELEVDAYGEESELASGLIIPENPAKTELIFADGVTVLPDAVYKGFYFSKLELPDSMVGITDILKEYQTEGGSSAIFSECVLDFDFELKDYFSQTYPLSACVVTGTLSIVPDYTAKSRLFVDCDLNKVEIPHLGNVEQNMFNYSGNVSVSHDFCEGLIDRCKIKELCFLSDPPMHLFTSRAGPDWEIWWSCRNNIEKIEFSSDVSLINKYMFWECKGLKEIDLSNITFVGEMAFKDCKDLEKVTFGSAPTVIEAEAFKNCNNANFVVNGPLVLTESSKNCFEGCNFQELPEIEGIIPDYAFANGSIKNCTLKADKISKTAFLNTKFENIAVSSDYPGEFKDGVLYWYEIIEGTKRGYAISCIKSLLPENLVMPDYVNGIKENVFAECKNLKSVTGAGLDGAGKRSFYNCENLEFVKAYYFTFYSESCFEGCKKLTSVYSTYFGEDAKNLIKSITHKAFKDCASLQEISFCKPNSSSENNTIFVDCFEGCTSLKKISSYVDSMDWWNPKAGVWSGLPKLEKIIYYYYEVNEYGDHNSDCLYSAKQIVPSSERDTWQFEGIPMQQEEFIKFRN